PRSRHTVRASCHDLQPVVKLQLHSAGDASPLTALLLAQIFPIFSVVAPCHRGASPPSVRRWTFTTGCWSNEDWPRQTSFTWWFEAKLRYPSARRPIVKNSPPSCPSARIQPSCASQPSTRQLS